MFVASYWPHIAPPPWVLANFGAPPPGGNFHVPERVGNNNPSDIHHSSTLQQSHLGAELEL